MAEYRSPETGPDFTESQEDRVVTLHGPVIRGIRRFKYYVGAALVVLAVGNGAVFQLYKASEHARCEERVERSREANKALAKLVEASVKDGDPHSAEVWREYFDASRKNPLPPC